MLKAKQRGCPPNIFKMLASYFSNREVGMFVGSQVVWKASTMGCPQGSVLGPAVWNLHLDNLLEWPMPEGVEMVAYADDVTLIIEANSRRDIENKAAGALVQIEKWGDLNKLTFSPAKTKSITLRGRFQRPPLIKMGGSSISCVDHAVVLGVTLDSRRLFTQHACDIVERAAGCYGKVSRITSTFGGVGYRALRTIYIGTFVATISYAASVWHTRVGVYPVRSALLRGQRGSLILMTKAYRSVSTTALPVLAGVLPADLQVRLAGEFGCIGDNVGRIERNATRRSIFNQILAEWQERWEKSDDGHDLRRFFPDVRGRVKAKWVEPDHAVSQILTGHGCFRGRLRDMGLSDVGNCFCGAADEYRDHILWECSLYAGERLVLLNGVRGAGTGPVCFEELVGTPANYRLLRKFAHDWFARRRYLEVCAS